MMSRTTDTTESIAHHPARFGMDQPHQSGIGRRQHLDQPGA